MPAGIPEDVVHIDLSNNSINHLKAKDFLGTKSLRILNISHNNMQHADTGMCTATIVRSKKRVRCTTDCQGNTFTCPLAKYLREDEQRVSPVISKIICPTLLSAISQVLSQDFCTFTSWICPTTACILSSMEFLRICISCLN